MPDICPMTHFITDYPRTPTFAALEDLIGNFCKSFDFLFLTYYATGSFYASKYQLKNGNILISNYPDSWTQFYFANQYEYIDPILHIAQDNLISMDWGDIELIEGEASDLFLEAKRHGLGSQGRTATIRDKLGELALLSVNTDQNPTQWQRKWSDHGATADFYYFAHQFHLRVKSVLEKTSGLLPRLSKREAEVLHWAALGKTAWETAQILKLTEGTVNYYVRNACKKLQVRRKAQAVSKCGHTKLAAM